MEPSSKSEHIMLSSHDKKHLKVIKKVVPVKFSYFLYRNKDSKVELSIQC